MLGKHKILVTGASGLLGSTIVSQYTNQELLTPTKAEFDLTHSNQISDYINAHKPTIIIHTAAHTNVDQAELQPDEAWRINTLGTLNICRATRLHSLKFIFISSTGIYGHHKTTPWKDFDLVSPPTVHHHSKYSAEQIVRNHISNHLILRTGWLFGGGLENPKNFVLNRYKEALGKKKIFANGQQFGNPTSAIDLAKQIELLITHDLIGTFNCVNKGSMSRLEYIREIVNAFDMDVDVEEQPNKFERPANVSNNEMAENYFLELLNLNIMQDFRPQLHVYIQELKKHITGNK